MVETLPAAFEIEEMLYEIRNYACGMNAGRWDYIFSAIKVLKARDDCIMPDRKQVMHVHARTCTRTHADVHARTYTHVHARACTRTLMYTHARTLCGSR